MVNYKYENMTAEQYEKAVAPRDYSGSWGNHTINKIRNRCAVIRCSNQKQKGCEGFCKEHWNNLDL